MASRDPSPLKVRQSTLVVKFMIALLGLVAFAEE